MDSTNWIHVDQELPDEGETVLATYKGVYPPRIVIFWRDGGRNPHFGYPASEPATHWLRIPRMPALEVSSVPSGNESSSAAGASSK